MVDVNKIQVLYHDLPVGIIQTDSSRGVCVFEYDKTWLALTGYLTQDSVQVEEMFRRMVMNLVAINKDDHAKNFSFICDSEAIAVGDPIPA